MRRLKFLFLLACNLYATDLSASIFVRLQLDTLGEIFYSIEATLEPKDGIDTFFDCLAMFLKSSKELSGKYLHFYVATNGKLYIEDTSPTATILNRFISNEKHWSPGINSGPTKLTCIYVELPIKKGKKTVYNRHIAYEGSSKSIDLGLYYSYVYPDFPYAHEIVSVIYNSGQYTEGIVHRGKNADDIFTLLTAPNTNVRANSTKEERIYFYRISNNFNQ